MPDAMTAIATTRRPRRTRRASSGWRWRLAAILLAWAERINPLRDRP